MAVKEIIKDVKFLSQKAIPATKADADVIVDVMDTLAANAEECVGMAANMIGVNKAIIAVDMGSFGIAMVNPVIVSKSKPYETEEGCLCLYGERKTKRYEEIEVEYLDATFHPQ